MSHGIEDPQNWERFKEAIEQYGKGGMMFEFNTPNLTMKYPATGLEIEWVMPQWSGNRDTLDLDGIDSPEDLPITGDGLIVRPPEDAEMQDFEVLFDVR